MNNTWSRRRALSWLVAFALVAAAGSMACSPGSGTAAPPVIKLAFVTNNASEFWKIAAAGVRKYEAEGRVQVDIKMPPNGTTEEQNQILENLASQGYEAIAVSAVAPNDQVPVLNRVAAKTTLITFDSDAPAVEAGSCTSAPTTTRRGACLAARSSSFSLRAATWPSSSARSRPTTPPSGSTASRMPSRATTSSRRSARRRHRSRQGPLERRGHH